MHKKEDLLNKAIKVLNSNPSMPFADICKEIGVSRATAYKNFKDKDDLLLQICNFVLDKTDEYLSEIISQDTTNKAKFEQIIDFKIDAIDSAFFIYGFSQTITNEEVVSRYYHQFTRIGTILKDMRNSGEIDEKIDIYWALYALDGLFYSGWYALNDGYFGIKQIKSNVKKSFFAQIGLKS